jgi:ABC-2 type transport system permease protein
MMRGLIAHFLLTLRLNLRSRQALLYGYLVPVIFLIAFGSIFRGGNPPLLRQLGQLLTISILGGACFGMPAALVAERERGIWRRYRLLPASTGGLIISTMAARFVIVLSAGLLQILLAWLMYGMPLPEHPLQLLAAFSAVTFAFLGLGLIIAMVADTVPAVQALGQMIFLPMIMIGGVGVPLAALPAWAAHAAAFLPGIHGVQALDAAVRGTLGGAGFQLAALLVIGAAACVAGSRMFRWDAHERADPRRRPWIFAALAAWLCVGIAAERLGVTQPPRPAASVPPAAAGEEWESITQAQIDAVSYEDLPDDDGTIAPIAASLTGLNPETQARVAEWRRQLAAWPPAAAASPAERVRNLLIAASIADLHKDIDEEYFGALVFEKLGADFPPATLEKIAVWLILHPAPAPQRKMLADVSEFKFDPGEAEAEQVAERVRMYATKLLGRLTRKRPGN